MSFVDKLKFWKKDDPFADDPFTGDFKFPSGLDSPGTPPGSGGPVLTTSAAPAFGDTAPPSPMPRPDRFPSVQPIERVNEQPKDLEIISLKLDAIKNSLESINMRLERLERLAQGEQKPNKTWYR